MTFHSGTRPIERRKIKYEIQCLMASNTVERKKKMPKFNAGDTVRLIRDHDGHKKGEILTVSHIDSTGYSLNEYTGKHEVIQLVYTKEGWGAFSFRFELVKEEPTPKFKIGQKYVVTNTPGETSYGWSWTVLDIIEGAYIARCVNPKGEIKITTLADDSKLIEYVEPPKMVKK